MANTLPCNDKILFTKLAVHKVLSPELTPHPAKALGEALCQQVRAYTSTQCMGCKDASLLELKEREVATVSSSWYEEDWKWKIRRQTKHAFFFSTAYTEMFYGLLM